MQKSHICPHESLIYTRDIYSKKPWIFLKEPYTEAGVLTQKNPKCSQKSPIQRLVYTQKSPTYFQKRLMYTQIALYAGSLLGRLALQLTATHCNLRSSLQLTATHCNALRHTHTDSLVSRLALADKEFQEKINLLQIELHSGGHELNAGLFLSHVSYETVTSRMNESWLIIHDSWWLKTHDLCLIRNSHVTYEWVMTHYSWLMMTQDSWLVSHTNEPCHICLSHVTYETVISHMNESWLIIQSHINESHINESCHIWNSHVTYVKMHDSFVSCESCLLHGFVMSHAWMTRV